MLPDGEWKRRIATLSQFFSLDGAELQPAFDGRLDYGAK